MLRAPFAAEERSDDYQSTIGDPTVMTDDVIAQTLSTASIPCPFTYARGRKCPGHVVRIEAFKADLAWRLGADGVWTFEVGQPRSHYHLYCSEKDNHAGYSRPDAGHLKFYYGDLPPQLRTIVAQAGHEIDVQTAPQPYPQGVSA